MITDTTSHDIVIVGFYRNENTDDDHHHYGYYNYMFFKYINVYIYTIYGDSNNLDYKKKVESLF